MAQVLSSFKNGFAGAVSRAVDSIIVSLANLSGSAIPFGAPLFLRSAGDSVIPYNSSVIQDASAFLGFAVRIADKTPETYGSAAASYAAGEPVDVLVRGTMVVPMEGTCYAGGPVYLRKSDGRLTANAGAADSTILLPNVSIRRPKDSAGFAEVVVRTRNLI